MVKRKSPIRHHVRSHKRKGRPVHSYERGKGKRKVKVSNPKITKSNKKQSNQYNVLITYPKLSNETFPVTASSYPNAVETALITRLRFDPPKEIQVTKT